MESTDTEEEVFFGPILDKEAKKAAKLRRQTEIFKPDFRHKLPPSTSSSSASSELEDDVFDRRCLDVVPSNRNSESSNGSTGSESKSRSDIFRESVFHSPRVTLRSLREGNSLRESPHPRSVDKVRTGTDREEDNESPFQKKTRALLDLIHKTKEEWNSPTQSPLSVTSTPADTPLKRKYLLSAASPALSPVAGYSSKVLRLSPGAGGKGEGCGNREGLGGTEQVGHRGNRMQDEVLGKSCRKNIEEDLSETVDQKDVPQMADKENDNRKLVAMNDKLTNNSFNGVRSNELGSVRITS